MKKLFNFSHYPFYLRKIYWSLASATLFRNKGVVLTGDVECFGLPIVELKPGSKVVLGARLSLCSDSRHTALGVSRPVILRTLLSGAQISIGDESGLSGTTICAANSVRIGNRCLIGADVLIADTDFHPLAAENRRYKGASEAASKPVVIEDDVFVGARSIVLKGVTIGKGSVIGAGSVVTTDIPQFTVAAGNPARVIREIG